MKIVTPARQATIYVNSTAQWRGLPLYSVIVQLCQQKGIAGVTVTRCVEGYGSSRHLHTTRLLELSEDLPVRIDIIDLPDRIDSLVNALEGMVPDGLIALHDVQVVRFQPASKSSS